MAILAPLLASWMFILLSPRTAMGVGFLPSALWVFPFGLLILASLLSGFSTSNLSVLRISPIFLVPLLFADSIPLKLCAILLSVAGILSISNSEPFKFVANGFLFAVITLAAGTAASNVYAHLEARYDISGFLAPGLSVAMNMLGATTAIAEGQIATHTSSGTIVILASPDKLGGEFLFVFLIAFISCSLALNFRKASIAITLLLLVPFTLLRAAAAMTQQLALESPNWWAESQLFMSFTPFVLAAYFSLGRATHRSDFHRIKNKPWLGLCAAFCGMTFLVAAWQWCEGGPVKSGKVVIDDGHSDWEWSDTRMDTHWFGPKSVYNYNGLADALDHYFPTIINKDPISEQLLSDTSVLILKTPTRSYTDSEQLLIKNFIRRGGGVWFIGDHTDAFGMDSNLNVLTESYGATFRSDALTDPIYGRNLYAPKSTSHFTVRNLPLFLFYTGDTLTADLFQPDTIQVGRLIRDPMDYSAGTYFGDLKPNLSDPLSYSVSAWQKRVGLGRVAFWTDSTLFSNFSIFVPGKLELARNTVDWLRRKNSKIDVRILLLAAGLICIVLALAYLTLSGDLIAVLIGSLSGIGIAIFALQFQSATVLPEAIAIRNFNDIAFFEKPITRHLPIANAIDEPEAYSYLTAYISAQRIGKRPVMCTDLSALPQGAVLIYIPWDNAVGTVRFEEMLNIAKAGGRLVVLDGQWLDLPLKDLLKERLGLNFISVPETGLLHLKTLAGKEIMPSRVADRITGGFPLLKTREGSPVCAVYRYGKGAVVVTTTSNSFSDIGTSHNMEIPSSEQLEAMDLLFEFYDTGPGNPLEAMTR